MQRKHLSKKIRFEILKRDNFTCMYCGKKAPDVLLVIDHIKPVKEGGDNSIENLITACESCNQGKAARKLSDNQEVSKSFKQLEIENQKIQQMKDVIRWKEEINKIKEQEISIVIQHLEDIVFPMGGRNFSEYGRNIVLDAYKKYGLEDCQDYIKNWHEDDIKRTESNRKRYSLIEFINFTKNKDNPKFKKKYIVAIALGHFSKSFVFNYVQKILDVLPENHYDDFTELLKSIPYRQRLTDEEGVKLLEDYEGFL